MFTYTVFSTGGPSDVLHFTWSVSGITADASDFAGGVLPSGSGMLAGGTSQTIQILVNGDVVPEPDEIFQITFDSYDSPGGGSNPDFIVDGTIEDDDGFIPTSYSIVPSSLSQFEGDAGVQIFRFTVVRSGDTSSSEGIEWYVTGGGAGADDFAGGFLPSGLLFFGVGQTQAFIDVPVSGDLNPELDESFTLNIQPYVDGGSSSSLPLLGSATGTILDDDTIPPTFVSIEPAAISQTEGDTGNRVYAYVISRTDATGTASVAWSVLGGSADAADFAGGPLPSGTVTFAPGESSRVVEILVSGDLEIEPDETFTVQLSNPQNLVIDDGTAAGTIVNDDVPTTLDLGPASISLTEGDTGARVFTYTVTRAGDLTEASTVNWSVEGTGLSPANAADFVGGVLPSGSVSFASGEATRTIEVLVSGDFAFEANEEFQVSLAGATGGTVGAGQAAGLIINDDTRAIPPLLAPQAQVHTEGGEGQQTIFAFTVRRFGDLREAAEGTWSLGAPSTGASASAGDFAATSGAFSFAAGAATAQITVAVVGDGVVEQTEGFEVLVAMPGIAAVIGRGVIINDDLAVPGAAGAEADPFAEASASPAGPTRVEVICDYDPYGWGGL